MVADGAAVPPAFVRAARHREAVEKIFNVKVADVKMVNTKPKPKRLGKYSGFKSGYKKAIVSLKEGSKIEIFERVN